eukprot:CAMPEP_0197884792 /NCGR_PEP_ID=MMETSP1439-20131203/11115_1 /TAXON_ID=66791 /ORGANISM="Gonyaulax spinifera, Strain CCMP409" /LENGTH=788 /DNA_ID=CAMNT_0043504535 /DNA_START=56 /DNA_END=2422 /DNA_ORIENTATION=+
MGCGNSKGADPQPGDDAKKGANAKAASGGGGATGGADAKAGEGKEENVTFLKEVELFKRLPESDLPVIAANVKTVSKAPGQTIIEQGATGEEFFLIKSGTCTVYINEKMVAELKAGDYFGENALLREQPRTATIKVKNPVEMLCLTREKFYELGLHAKVPFPKRGACGGGNFAVEHKEPSSFSPDETKLIQKALQSNQNLSEAGVQLDENKIKSIISKMWKEDVTEGKELIQQGDLSADYFYVVTSGSFEINKAKETQSAETAAQTSLGMINTGGSFGELALLYLAPRAATITATSPSVVAVLDRPQFKEIMVSSDKEAAKEYIKYLDKVTILAELKPEEKEKLAEALIEVSFVKDQTIFEKGEPGDYFYILIEGEVTVFIDSKNETKLKVTEKEKPCFGEKALQSKAPRAATIKVISESARALTLDKVGFDMLIGPLADIDARGKAGTATVKKVVAVKAETTKRFGVIPRQDLKRLGLLGCGGFGAVEMVEHLKSGETYALKALSKGYVVKSGMQQSVMSEKNVQLLCDSPFVIQLYETYNGEQSLYLLLELALGGELYATYNKKSLWGKEECAKFYVAGTTFAFEHLHSRKIIFRDLKPENLLLNEFGQVKLTDMGLAKVVVGKTYTTCGTPDYFAPELIASKGHTHAVDWWTLGVLTFELLSGHPPFESATPMQIYQKVTKGINRVVFPKKCKTAEHLIKGLCHMTPSERLPMKKGHTKNIKDHSWFSGFNWEKMFTFDLDAPYKPVVKSKKDVANFSARKEDMPPQIPYKDDGTGWDKEFATST